MRIATAETLLEHNDNKAAMLLVDTLLRSNPDYEPYMVFKAYILGRLRRTDEAAALIDSFTTGRHTATFYMKRANYKYVCRLYAAAIPDLNKAAKHHPTAEQQHTLLVQRGQSAYFTRHFRRATKDIRHLLKQDSTNIDAFTVMCNILNMTGNTTDIKPYLDRGLQQQPSNTILKGNLAYWYQNMGQYAKAIEVNTEAMMADTSSTFYVNNRGYDRYMMGDLAGGLTDVNRAIMLGPDNSYAYRNRALIYMAMKRTDDACKDLHEAAGLGYRNSYGNEVDKLIKKNCQ